MGRPTTCTKEQFISRAVELHKNKYNYDKVIFINLSQKVEITCNDCLYVFTQFPYRHLKGSGCQACALEVLAARKRISIKDFIERSNIIHGNKFNYNKVSFTSTSNKVDIYCNKCKTIFTQKVADHLYGGYGCTHCAKTGLRLTQEEFVNKALEKHGNKYDYNASVYIKTESKIKIKCNNCNEIFEQTPHAHINGQGCYDCGIKNLASNFSSVAEKDWLDSLNVPAQYRQKAIKTNNKRYLVDAFDPTTNTIWEFNGDYFHGNPKIFDSNKMNIVSKRSFGELYHKTLEKEEALKTAGYNVISMWEDDWNIKNGKRRNIRICQKQ